MTYKIGLVFMMILLVSDLFAGQGKIRISSDQEGAYIFIDGKKKAMTGEGFTTILLDEGDHVVKVVKSIDSHWQYVAKKSVFIGDDTSIKISLTLKKKMTEKGKTAQKKRWKRDANVVIDKKQNLMWQDNSSAGSTQRDWSGAKSYCRNLSLAGYSDWRLPSYDELLSIVDYDRYKPAIFSLFKNTASSFYWSSSVSVSRSSYAWYVDFSDGYTDDDGSKTYKHYVRCVRAGQ
jgi:hypothetical protein